MRITKIMKILLIFSTTLGVLFTRVSDPNKKYDIVYRGINTAVSVGKLWEIDNLEDIGLDGRAIINRCQD
jgi:hypothetical protein